MAGATFEITINDSGARDLFKRLARRVSNMTPVFAEIGEIITESVQRNFEEKVSPEGEKWAPLAAATKARKRHPGEILVELGTLFSSIHPEAHRDHVSIGTNIIYAAVHQFGIGRYAHLKTRRVMPAIPARPYLGIRDDDWPEILDAIEHWIMQEAV